MNKAKQIVDTLLQIPSLVTALREDPDSFGRRVGLGEEQSRALSGVTSLVTNLLNRAKGPQQGSCSQLASPSATSRPDRPAAASCANGGNATALVGTVALTAVAGAIAVLGTVSVVAIHKGGDGQ
jgi:hypothetical protein